MIPTLLWIIGRMVVSFAIIWLILSYYNINPKFSVVIIIGLVIFTGFIMKPLLFVAINNGPKQNEMFQVRKIDYNIRFQDDGSVNIEHILKLRKNKDTINPKNQIIQYAFDEAGKVSNLAVSVNSQQLEYYEKGGINTFNLQNQGNKNILTIYPPFVTKEDLELRVSYLSKNALKLYTDDEYTYYNTLLSERSGFSFNTNVKGTVNFYPPENSNWQVGSFSQDLYLIEKSKNSNSISFQFENRLPYEKQPFGNKITVVEEYDPRDFNNSKNSYYKNDYSIITRAVFKPQTPLKIKEAPPLDNSKYTVLELKHKNERKNKDNYSDVLFVIGWISSAFSMAVVTTFTIVAFKIIFDWDTKFKRKMRDGFDNWL